MLGEQLVKVKCEVEESLKKFLEKTISNTEVTTTDKVNFGKGDFVIFDKEAERYIGNMGYVENEKNFIRYLIKIYYSKDIKMDGWAEKNREDLFFAISFNHDDAEYNIIVKSDDTKNFANYRVTVYSLPDASQDYTHSKIADYYLSALNELEEYKFIDGLMERAKKLVLKHVSVVDTIDDRKQEFLSIISDVINTGN